ncbi:MAG: PEP/pyruvate-binding domain-containing protein [Promethearchaeota archaeon]
MTKIESFTLELTDIDDKTKGVGIKSANLGDLLKKNFLIPDGFVVKTSAYELFLTKNNLMEFIQKSLESINFSHFDSVMDCANLIQNSIEKGVLPEELIEEIKQKYQQFFSYTLAVRSSATFEDLPDYSFAGQYDTYLNLKNLEQVLLHIKKCYASLWTSRAIVYRKKNRILHHKVKMAVIIQKMVLAKCSGVLFTINPLTSNNNELVIESNYGLGDSIVLGNTNPDQFFVQKIKKNALKILSKRIGNKILAARAKSLEADGGIEYIELSNDLIKESSLSDSEIIKLAKIGLQIEKRFNGIPQDIEWAIDQNNQINILQTRPVTAIKSRSKGSKILWSRGYSDDYWNDNVSPLFFELLGDHITKVVNIELNSIMGYKKVDTILLKLHNAHVYFNLNVIKKKIENEIPKFMRNEDVLNYFPEGSGTFGKITMKELPFHLIKRIVAELRVMLHDPNGSMSKTARAYEKWNEEIFDPYCKEFDKKLQKTIETGSLLDLIDLIDDLNNIMVTHFRLIRYGIPVHNIGMNLLIQYLLTRFLSKKECLNYYPILVSGLKHKLTDTNDKIHYIASLINKNSELKSIIVEEGSEKIYNRLSSEKNLLIKDFMVEFEKFLNDHGDRGFTREIYYPRWREPPMTNIFDILKSLIIDFQELEKLKIKNLKKRYLIEKLVESKIRSQRFGLLKWKFFSIILKNSRKYIKFREDQRFNLDRWITRNRNVYLEIGKIFVKEGILSDINRIFFLYKQEIKNLALNKYNQVEIQKISSEVRSRYEDFISYENKTPPKFLLGSREFDDLLKYNKKSKVFHGTAASQGIITASVRVVQDINLISTVQTGDILVVPRTDPGWTPVFSKIGGLITETGGILSHGAVISREYSIPAVTNIANACEIFKTGQIVNVNGFTGVVILQ